MDWFVAVELDEAGLGFEKAYSFNASLLPGSNDTIFMKGFSRLNYLLGPKNGANPKKDLKQAGTQQSVILFNKEKTPPVNEAGGDGYPTRVYFNGEECVLPTRFPNRGEKNGVTMKNIFLSLVFALAYLLLE